MNLSENSIVIDVDGTLCELKRGDQPYLDVLPKEAVITTLRRYKKLGYRIILYTSRNMRTYNKNIGEINAKTLPVLIQWLEKYDIPYDEIHIGKPWPGPNGFYVDDRTIRPEEFVALSEVEIQKILGEKG